MIGEFFVLLMFFGEPIALQEFTIRDGLRECLSTKRTIERNLQGSSAVVRCSKENVEYIDDFEIIKFIDGEPNVR